MEDVGRWWCVESITPTSAPTPAEELIVPGFGRRDGVGVRVCTGMLLSTVLVGMVPEIDVGGEKVIKGVLYSN